MNWLVPEAFFVWGQKAPSMPRVGKCAIEELIISLNK